MLNLGFSGLINYQNLYLCYLSWGIVITGKTHNRCHHFHLCWVFVPCFSFTIDRYTQKTKQNNFLLILQDVLVSLYPLLDRLVHMETLSIMERNCLNQLLQRFTPGTYECLAEGSKGLDLYIKAQEVDCGTEEDKTINSQIVAISQVTCVNNVIVE